MSYQLSHLGEEEVFESERRMPIEDIGCYRSSDKSDEFTEDDLRLLELLLGQLEAERISLQNNRGTGYSRPFDRSL